MRHNVLADRYQRFSQVNARLLFYQAPEFVCNTTLIGIFSTIMFSIYILPTQVNSLKKLILTSEEARKMNIEESSI